MKNILERIVEDKKQSLEQIKKEKSLDVLEKSIKEQSFFDFKGAFINLISSNIDSSGIRRWSQPFFSNNSISLSSDLGYFS